MLYYYEADGVQGYRREDEKIALHIIFEGFKNAKK